MVTQVTVQGTDSGPTLQEQAAAQEAAAAEAAKQAQGDALPSDGAGTEERPEWLPEKFKSVEDMAKAYSELEKAQGKGDQKPEDPPAEALKAVEKAGLDMDALSAEYSENGKLSDEALGKLQEVGITEEMVETYAAGQAAQLSNQQAEMLEPIGGDAGKYEQLTAWATENLSNEEIDAFNAVLDTGEVKAVQLAVKDLNAKFTEANGQEPEGQLTGDTATTYSSTYADTAEMMKDMQDPRYRESEAFRQKVAAKLARSSIM